MNVLMIVNSLRRLGGANVRLARFGKLILRDAEASPAPGVIWVVGYSGSGKTTVGSKLISKLRGKGIQSVFFDGDELRSLFGSKWGYSREERIDLARVYFRFCHHLNSQGLTVVISAVAMYQEIYDWFKDYIKNGFIAFLDVPDEELRRRDAKTKKLYQKIDDLNLSYDRLTNPDLSIPNFGDITPAKAAEQILNFFESNASMQPSFSAKDKYWNDVYTTSDVTVTTPTPFAIHICSTLESELNILDAGCGNGRDAVYFAEQGKHKITAMDPSQAGIDLCKKIHKNNQIKFKNCKISDLDESELGKFDLIYSRFLIHAITEIEENEFLRWSFELLKPDGLLAIECRSARDSLAREGEVIGPNERITSHYRRFIIHDDLIERLESHGFTIDSSIESAGLAMFESEDPIIIRIFAKK